ncbi:phospho-sugar mutase [Haliovirga abyssi]|uniref:Phosphoglucomutase n=1 Tax=Haliovirga abyssi TaxID=2996794 RepID=A0AAU9DS09_9FUSO|nr:phospho-sugar mutase [Haliovirga abyssi]BDU49764.1 phosphoglucomutase [Haliovirga abyssi]
MKEYMKKYEEWLASDYIEAEDKKELEAIRDDEKEIEERFYQDLEFGTGGLRGIRGMGTNRINEYVIRKATQGLINYMLKNDEKAKEKGIVIAYDSRIKSYEFALNTALVAAGNGVKAYLFESLRPTPMLSFAVRELGALSGVVVTASHNPSEYNGYKAYWEDGAQVTAPHDVLIIEEVKKMTDLSQVKIATEEEAKKNGLLTIIGKEIDDKFIAELKKLAIKPNIVKEVADKLKVVYTPLNGTGNVPVQRILKDIGLKNLYVVKEQEMPDGNFTTVGYPNPEDPKVFKLGIKLAEEVGAKIIMANDPDADRIGISIKSKTGEWIYPNGNQVGILLSEYILSNMKKIPENGVIISTVVSTPMLDKVAKAYGVEVIRTLTGFKFIGEKIKEFKEGKYDKEFIFGFEESYGYLRGTHSRDKDAIVATMLITEMVAYFESIGTTVEEQIEKMYEKYGYYKEGIKAVTMQGKEGAEKIVSIMKNLRENSPKEILGKKVRILNDFLLQKEKNLIDGTEKELILPKSNVLQFILEDDTYITARPSGTEPKIKFYFGVNADTKAGVEEKLSSAMEDFLKIVM